MTTAATLTVNRELAEQRIGAMAAEVHVLAVRLVEYEQAAKRQEYEGRFVSAEGIRERREELVLERSGKLEQLNLERQILRFGETLMTTRVSLLELMDQWVLATAPGIVEEAAERDREHLAFVSLGLGVQFALELSQLDPEVARELITELHESQPDSVAEHNQSAKIFLDLVARRLG